MDLAIIVVVYNDKDNVLRCLESIEQNSTSRRFQIIVVDNNSSDGVEEAILCSFPKVTIIKNNKNVGYTKANNQGMKASNSEYILLLNPDTEIPSNTIEDALALMDAQKDIGLLGPKLVTLAGKIDFACRRSFPNHWDYLIRGLGLAKLWPSNSVIGRYNLLYTDPDSSRDVGAIAGAFALARRSAVEEVGYLDEIYFIYGDDLDWCYRFTQKGWRVHYYPALTVLHHKGGTTRRISPKMIFHFYRSNTLLYKKRIAPNTFFIINGIIYLGLLLSFIGKFLYNLTLPPKKRRVNI